jgi:2-dehydropantoate 2-reductase
VKHAILGVGGVGGLLGGGLARSQNEVLLLLTERSLAEYPGALRVESGVLGDFEVSVPAAARLDRPVDVLWVTVKANALEAALALAPPEAVGEALVVPLLNGIDHVTALRERYGSQVVAASIAVESEKLGPGHIVQPGPFAIVNVAPAPGIERLVEELNAAGFTAAVRDSEARVLWTKLATLAPLALGTSSVQGPMGAVRGDPGLWELVLACASEACAVAATEGVSLDAARLHQTLAGIPPDMRSSMQKDLASHRPLELEAIAGPILRRAAERGIQAPATEELRRRVMGRAAATA